MSQPESEPCTCPNCSGCPFPGGYGMDGYTVSLCERCACSCGCRARVREAALEARVRGLEEQVAALREWAQMVARTPPGWTLPPCLRREALERAACEAAEAVARGGPE